MSKKNNDAKRTARERMAAERAKEQAAAKRKRAFVIGGSVVAVLAIAAGVGIGVGMNKSKDDEKNAQSVDSLTKNNPLVYPKGAYGAEGVVLVDGKADAPAVLTVYEDFRCPICHETEKAIGDTIKALADEGKVRVEYHIASFLDGKLTGSGSRNAANAAACASDAGKFRQYHDVLYANQPEETDDGFGKNAKLLELAGKVDGLRSPTFDQCVNNGTYLPWVKKVQGEFDKAVYGGAKVNGTPTMGVNNQLIKATGKGNGYASNGLITPEGFRAAVDAAIAATPKAAPATPFTPPNAGQPTPAAS